MPKGVQEETFKAVIYQKDKIRAAIGKVKTDATSVRNRLHNLAVSVAKVWHDEGEGYADEAVELINELVNASPYHARYFAQWVGMRFPFDWAEETEQFFVRPENRKLMGKQFMSIRDEDQFWKVAPPPKPHPMNLLDELQKLIDRAGKHHKKPVEGDNVDMSVVRQLTDIKNAMKGAAKAA